MELDDRKVTILKAIIKTYLETGEPVGSRTISKYTDIQLSSATIRNEMSDLEEMGYIVQPHTSAGRIPSDKGYRFYVDQILQEKEAEVTEVKELGTHHMFLAEVMAVQVDERCMKKSGKFELNSAGLLAYSHGEYRSLGDRIGRFGWSVKKRK